MGATIYIPGVPSSRHRFRDDIQGLRGVAVLAVVADHLDISGVSGGFAGVDVFFVISGFLIVGLMYGEARRTSRISVAAFYGRRARRILPAAMLVIFAVVVFAKLTMNPIADANIDTEALWSTSFAMNILLMIRGSDYFAQYDSVSPFQHYWSLGVEEQFYLVLPGLFLLGLALASRRRQGNLNGLVIILAFITTASLAWCLWSSSHLSTASTYFSSLARAWQIGLGGLLAIALANRWIVIRKRAAEVIGLAGLLMLGLTFALVGEEGYPGLQALLPVAGALAVIASGSAVARDGFTQKLLSCRVLTLVGLVSFSFYLWHWPVIIFGYRLWPSLQTSSFRIPLLLSVAAALSVLSYAFVERPARRLSWYRFAESPNRAALIRRYALPVALLPVAIITVAVLGAPGFMERSGDSHSGRISAIASGTEAQWDEQLRQSLDLTKMPNDLSPPLADVPNDLEPMECLSIDQTNMARCSWGGPRATKEVVVLGDSHAHMWLTAIRYAFPPSQYRVQMLTKASCSNAQIARREPGEPDLGPACDSHRRWARQQIQHLKPDVVVMSDFAGFTTWTAPDGTPMSTGVRAAWRRGLAESLHEIAPLTPRIVLIGQTPEGKALADCLPRDLSLENCYGDDTYMAGQRAIEKELVDAVGGTYVDPGPWLCVDGRCPPVIDGTAVLHDDNHLTVAMERKLAPLLAERVRTDSGG